MTQFIAEYWSLWLVLFVGFRIYIRHNTHCRTKRIQQELEEKIDECMHDCGQEEKRSNALREARASLQGVISFFIATLFSWIMLIFLVAAMLANMPDFSASQASI